MQIKKTGPTKKELDKGYKIFLKKMNEIKIPDSPEFKPIINKTNEELNKTSEYIHKKCCFCDRSYPETILNINGFIHHKEKIRCLNTKDCQKHIKKKDK